MEEKEPLEPLSPSPSLSDEEASRRSRSTHHMKKLAIIAAGRQLGPEITEEIHSSDYALEALCKAISQDSHPPTFTVEIDPNNDGELRKAVLTFHPQLITLGPREKAGRAKLPFSAIFFCRRCPRGFTRYEHLLRHEGTQHPDRGPSAVFTCPHRDCLKEFASKARLARHSHTHLPSDVPSQSPKRRHGPTWTFIPATRTWKTQRKEKEKEKEKEVPPAPIILPPPVPTIMAPQLPFPIQLPPLPVDPRAAPSQSPIYFLLPYYPGNMH